MGYQITFVPTEEKMNSYKPYNEASRDINLNMYKYELLSFCMKEHTDSVFSMTRYLKNTLTFFASQIEQLEKYNAYDRWKNDENHWLWYCGWEWAHESNFEKEDIIERHVKDLLIFADLVKTPDYFKNADDFYKKIEDVTEYIDGFVELIEDIAIHNIIDDLREFELGDDDEDEPTSCPEYESETGDEKISDEEQIQNTVGCGLPEVLKNGDDPVEPDDPDDDPDEILCDCVDECCESDDDYDGSEDECEDECEGSEEFPTYYIDSTAIIDSFGGNYDIDVLYADFKDHGADVDIIVPSLYYNGKTSEHEYIKVDDLDIDEIVEIMKDEAIDNAEDYIFKYTELK